MSVLVPIHEMALKDLLARIRIHESIAQMFEERGESSTARVFRSLAAEYRAEVDLRPDTAE